LRTIIASRFMQFFLFGMLLSCVVCAQDQLRAVAPAQSGASGNRV
jgi:hypothetical protein